jgi:hypothetical protein
MSSSDYQSCDGVLFSLSVTNHPAIADKVRRAGFRYVKHYILTDRRVDVVAAQQILETVGILIDTKLAGFVVKRGRR